MPIVKPHQYADTPIFRGLLYERDGRFPGTPENEEVLPEVELTPVPVKQSMFRVEPQGMAQKPQAPVYKPMPVRDEESHPEALNGHQPPISLFEVEPDDEA